MITTSYVEKVIKDFMALPKDWDGHGSPTVSSQAIKTFEKFAKQCFKFLYLRHILTAVSGGGIQIDCNYECRTVTFEIYPDGLIGFEKFEFGDNKRLVPEHSVYHIDNLHIVGHLNELLSWLIN